MWRAGSLGGWAVVAFRVVRVLGASAALVAIAAVAGAVPDAHAPRPAQPLSGWTAYLPLSGAGADAVREYPATVVIAPPGAIPATSSPKRVVIPMSPPGHER